MVAYKGMPKATKDEIEYLSRVKQLPCCLCIGDEQRTPTEGHHCKIGNKRIGHFYVIPVCQWHHRRIFMQQYKHAEPQLLANTHKTLGIKDKPWPTSKIIARRTVLNSVF